MSQAALAEGELRTRFGQADACAVVVTHHPGPTAIDSIEAIAPQVRELLIIDNGSTAGEIAPVEEAALRLGARVVRFGFDMGTGAALNYALESARKQGHKWLATFDQDSRVSASMLARMERSLSAYPESKLVAIVAPVQADDPLPAPKPAAPAAPPKASPLSAPNTAAPAPTPPPARWRVLKSTLVSGAMLNVAAASRVGGFDASLFLDYVDEDFCLRLRKEGFQILEASEVRMPLPAGKMEIPLSGRPEPQEAHAPIRRYYITRNRMLLWRRHGGFDLGWMLSDIGACFREFFSMLFWEKGVPGKLWMMARGAFDALRNARGELSGHPR